VAIGPQDNLVYLTSSHGRFVPFQDPQPDGTKGIYYVTFNSGDWDTPIIVTTHAVQRSSVEDPHDTTIIASVDPSSTAILGTIPTTDTFYKNAATPLLYSNAIKFVDSPTGDMIIRSDGGSFKTDGFLAGEQILIFGDPYGQRSQ
jgi:hypothetical protein